MNCNDWSKGLNNTYIENNKNIHGCYINQPKFCYYKIGKYFLDFTKIKNYHCHNNKENTKKMLLHYSTSKYVNKNTKRFGFPLLNKNSELFISYNSSKLRNYIKKNLLDMDNKKLINKINNKPEIIVDYTNNPFGKIIINIKYNKTLSEERKKKEVNTSPYSKNIILLFIDSVSRAYSIRQLKKTLKFFEKFMKYKGDFNKKYPTINFHSFQFFKYHAFYGSTFNNYPKIFYGNNAGKNIIKIIKYFKENGYVTSYSNDLCTRDNSNTIHNLTYEEIGDHEFLIK